MPARGLRSRVPVTLAWRRMWYGAGQDGVGRRTWAGPGVAWPWPAHLLRWRGARGYGGQMLRHREGDRPRFLLAQLNLRMLRSPGPRPAQGQEQNPPLPSSLQGCGHQAWILTSGPSGTIAQPRPIASSMLSPLRGQLFPGRLSNPPGHASDTVQLQPSDPPALLDLSLLPCSWSPATPDLDSGAYPRPCPPPPCRPGIEPPMLVPPRS